VLCATVHFNYCPNIWHCPTGAPSFYCASGTECYCPIFGTAQPGLQVFIVLPAQNSNVHPCTVPMSWYCTNIVVLSIPMCNVVHCTNVVVLLFIMQQYADCASSLVPVFYTGASQCFWANSFYAGGGIPPQQGQFIYRQHSSATVVDIPVVLTGGQLFGCCRPQQVHCYLSSLSPRRQAAFVTAAVRR